ncbi:helix-turn-helix domain-containing protein [Leptospira sanjuanensis]|uniref:helix-turn-helix domain-containing protein n=1 Tax=Leptospira sanjuanensis TaxID=2879643 RepID=UPI001EE7A81C|nr:helix-turn-helix transcriptional regulator [Leptospira sanjuanensis]MCG6170161.1 helix-turn-helix domain-containing protein [Leptospira sanjuanensis]
MGAKLVSRVYPQPESRKRAFWWPFHAQKHSSEQTNSNITGEISVEQRKSFFERLRAARIETNLTQTQVSAKLGKYQSYMSKIESGKKRLFIEDFIRLCELYNRPPAYFYSVFSK